jgi:anthranilate synthase component II
MPVSTKVLLIDNYDSFTYNLAQYFWELGFNLTVKRNDQTSLEEIQNFDPSHIVISPGPGTPDDSGISMEVIAEFYNKRPLLGVCLGHQCIGQYFGATIERAPLPRHGKTSPIGHHATGVFINLPNPFQATRYHSLTINEKTLAKTKLKTTAVSLDDNLVMGVKHLDYPIFGVQFHPESIMTQHGHQMLKNFIDAA